jgi:hypothetical protein
VNIHGKVWRPTVSHGMAEKKGIGRRRDRTAQSKGRDRNGALGEVSGIMAQCSCDTVLCSDSALGVEDRGGGYQSLGSLPPNQFMVCLVRKAGSHDRRMAISRRMACWSWGSKKGERRDREIIKFSQEFVLSSGSLEV